MFVNGISIDSRGTKLIEDGFFAKKIDSSYELIYAVVDIASSIGNARAFMSTGKVSSAFTGTGLSRSDFAFTEQFKDAFFFRVMVSDCGEVESFTPFRGKFALRSAYNFNDDIKDSDYYVAKDCLEVFLKNQSLPQLGILSPLSSNQALIRALNMLVSSLLANYLIKEHRISAIVTGIQVHSFVVPSKYNVNEGTGNLIKMTSNHGALVEGRFASPVRLKYVRANCFLSDQVDMGTMAISIASPLRSADALINQVILYDHLENVLDFDYVKSGDLKIMGPTIHERVRYMEITTNHCLYDKVDSGGLFLTDLSGRFLREFVFFLIGSKKYCPQLNSENLFRYCSFTDRVRLLAYFISLGVYPDFLIKWLKIRSKKSGKRLVHLLRPIDLLFMGEKCRVLVNDDVYFIEGVNFSDEVFLKNILKLVST